MVEVGASITVPSGPTRSASSAPSRLAIRVAVMLAAYERVLRPVRTIVGWYGTEESVTPWANSCGGSMIASWRPPRVSTSRSSAAPCRLPSSSAALSRADVSYKDDDVALLEYPADVDLPTVEVLVQADEPLANALVPAERLAAEGAADHGSDLGVRMNLVEWRLVVPRVPASERPPHQLDVTARVRKHRVPRHGSGSCAGGAASRPSRPRASRSPGRARGRFRDPAGTSFRA